MKLTLKAGVTSQTVNIFVRDSTSTTGAGLTGLVFNSAGLTAYYMLPRAVAVSITLATLAAVTSAYSSGGFKEIDSTNAPGWYRFDIPDAAIASGIFSSIHLKGAANMAPLPLEIELVAVDLQDATAFGLSRLDAAISSRMATFTLPANFAAFALTVGGAVTVGTNSDKTGYSLSQAFPANFAALAITAGGAVTAGTVSDKTGYSLTQAFPTNFASLAIDASGRVTLVPGQFSIKKNTGSQQFSFLMTDSTTHVPKTTLTVTATRSIDGAAFGACSAAVTEIANGWYTIVLSATDTNGSAIALRFTATAADDRNVLVVTQP